MLTALVVLLILAGFLYLYHHIQKNSKSPPGPWNLPIIGSLHLLDPQAPHISLTKLSERYGPIFSLKLGFINTVVVADARLAKKIFMKDETIGKPPLYLLEYALNGKGILYTSGNMWKDQRKLVVNFLRAAGASKNSINRKVLEQQILKNVQEFIQYVHSQKSDVIEDLPEAIAHYVSNVSSFLFFGLTWSRDDKMWQRFIQLMQEFAKVVVVGGPVNFLPILRFLPKYRDTLSLVKEIVSNVHSVHNKIIKELTKSSPNDDECPSNLVEAFLAQKSKCNSEEIYNMEQLRHLLVDVFGASVETTITSLLWIVLYMTEYPEVQNKVRQQLLEVVQERPPQIEDLPNLPYLEATIAEASRIRTTAPLGFPHWVSEDIKIDNFQIAKGTMVMPLLWGMHMDPKVWDKPEEFCPDRFLNEDGKFCRPETLVPFQIGKRICVGEEMSRITMFLFVAVTLQNFRIESSDGAPLDLNGVCGITLTPKPQKLRFIQI